jgi:menaquinone-dependent protoporphyrinogen oxidase
MVRAILILYSTVDGHTVAICSRIAGRLGSLGHRVTVASLEEAAVPDPAGFNLVVIGASIRYGRHRPSVARFINERANVLAARPGALFSVNVVARKPGKDTASGNAYVRKLLASIRWKPTLVDVFAGCIDYPRYGPLDRAVIRFIMWITGGPTDPAGRYEFTDWQRVDAFADALAAL